MIVTCVVVASAGPLTSTCSGRPSSARTVMASPLMSPNGSPAAGSGRSLILPTAIFSAITTAPAPAAIAPAASPLTPVSLRQLTIRPLDLLPARACHRSVVTCAPGPGRGRRHGRDPHPSDSSFCYVSLGYPTVASRDLSGKPRHDVIGHGPKQVGPFLGGRLALVAWTKQHDFVSCLDGHVAG